MTSTILTVPRRKEIKILRRAQTHIANKRITSVCAVILPELAACAIIASYKPTSVPILVGECIGSLVKRELCRRRAHLAGNAVLRAGLEPANQISRSLGSRDSYRVLNEAAPPS
jgi:hypothetical protein